MEIAKKDQCIWVVPDPKEVIDFCLTLQRTRSTKDEVNGRSINIKAI